MSQPSHHRAGERERVREIHDDICVMANTNTDMHMSDSLLYVAHTCTERSLPLHRSSHYSREIYIHAAEKVRVSLSRSINEKCIHRYFSPLVYIRT